MISQPPKQKGFFAKYWGLLLAGGLVLGFLFVAVVGVGAYFLLRADVQANGITFSTETPELGKTLTAKVQLENKGILDADYHAVLLVDGQEADADDIKLVSDDPQTLTFDLKGLSAGKHTASIAGVEKEFTIYRPAKLEVTDFIVVPESIMVGETVKVTVTISNSGELSGDFVKQLTCDGADLQEIKTTVAPGEENTLQAEFTLTDKGVYSFALEGQTRKVTALAPARIEVKDLKLSKTYPAPKEAVTATVTVENTGDLPGDYTVVLSVNGKAAQQKDVTVDPNSTMDVAFKISQTKAGAYSVKSGEVEKSMRVVTITRPANGTYLVRKAKNGSNLMKITNNFDKDAIVTLTKATNPKEALVTIYIRAKSTVTIKSLPNGDYCFFYSLGKSYDSTSKKFISDAEYMKAETVYSYSPPRGYYTTWTITMNVSGGDVTNSDVGESGFPK